MHTSRRKFLRSAAGATYVGVIAGTVGLGRSALAQGDSTEMVFRLSTRNTRTCSACRNHARYKVFETGFLADTNRAHPGCNCPVTDQRIDRSLLERLQATPTGLAGVWDRRKLDGATSQSARQLVPDWNLIGVPGGGRISELLLPIGGQFDAVFAWNAGAQTYVVYYPQVPPQVTRRQVPPQVNTLQELQSDQAIWIRITNPAGASLPLPQEDSDVRPPAVTLLRGWNLVPWRGPDRVTAAEATTNLGAALEMLWRWDAALQRFELYIPAIPERVQLRTSEGVWIRVDRAVEWDQAIEPMVSPDDSPLRGRGFEEGENASLGRGSAQGDGSVQQDVDVRRGVSGGRADAPER